MRIVSPGRRAANCAGVVSGWVEWLSLRRWAAGEWAAESAKAETVKGVTGMNVVGREKGLQSSSRGQGGSVARRTWRMAAATGKSAKWYSTMQITDEAHCVIRDDTQH